MQSILLLHSSSVEPLDTCLQLVFLCILHFVKFPKQRVFFFGPQPLALLNACIRVREAHRKNKLLTMVAEFELKISHLEIYITSLL